MEKLGGKWLGIMVCPIWTGASLMSGHNKTMFMGWFISVQEHFRPKVDDRLWGHISSALPLYVLDTSVRRLAELSADHHLVVRSIRWWGRLLDRAGNPKLVVRVNWKRLAEKPIQGGGCGHGIWVIQVRSLFCWAAGSCGQKSVVPVMATTWWW